MGTFVSYFLGYTDEDAENYHVPFLYYVDNSVTFPSKKYKLKGPFEHSGQMKRFKNAIRDREWDNFYVSEPPIQDPENGKNGVVAVTRDNYKQKIKQHRGDVILMLVNSEHMGQGTTAEAASQDMKMLRMFYAVANRIREEEGGKHVLCLAIDILKNDLPEFRGMGSPTFLLYDYLDKR